MELELSVLIHPNGSSLILQQFLPGSSLFDAQLYFLKYIMQRVFCNISELFLLGCAHVQKLLTHIS